MPVVGPGATAAPVVRCDGALACGRETGGFEMIGSGMRVDWTNDVTGSCLGRRLGPAPQGRTGSH